MWVARPDGRCEHMNASGSHYLGVTAGAHGGPGWLHSVHPEDAKVVRATWEHSLQSGRALVIECRLRRVDSDYRWMDVRGLPVRGADGQILRWVGTCSDIEDERRLRGTLRAAELHAAESHIFLDALESTAPVGFGFVDREFRYLRVNETLAAVNGVSIERHAGRTVAEVVPALWERLRPAYTHVLETGEAVVNQEVTGSTPAAPEDTRLWLTSYYPVRTNGEIVGVGFVVVDITERREAEELRSVVTETMAEGLYVQDPEGRLIFMNPAASRMLGWTEDELRGKPMHAAIHFQRADGSPHPDFECELLKVSDQGRALQILDDAYTRKDGAIFPVAYSAAPLLIGSRVHGVVVVFRDTSEERAHDRRARRELDALSWIGRIRDALDEGRFVLYTQPIVPLAGGEPRDELLLRMVGPNGEIIAPGSFLPAAEKYGLISEIDRWVVGEAIRLAATGRRVQANVSVTSIPTLDLLSLIERELRATRADPKNIVFEITETAFLEGIELAEAFAHGLSTIGCGLALDDFGTGFASLTYLTKLPIKYLKIDIDFVRDLTSDPASQHVVKGIVNLAKDFGQQTIAEGVEDAATLALLERYGVDFAQGFHVGRPQPIAALNGKGRA